MIPHSPRNVSCHYKENTSYTYVSSQAYLENVLFQLQDEDVMRKVHHQVLLCVFHDENHSIYETSEEISPEGVLCDGIENI